MTIRTAEYKDIPMISNILAASWKSEYRGIVNDDYLDSLKEDSWVGFLTDRLDNENIFSIVVEDKQQIIGVAILGRENVNHVNLISFYLLPDKIGQGYGHAFYQTIEDEIKRRNYTKCVIDVLEENTRAIRFYEAHGFVDTNEIIKATLGDFDYLCKVYKKMFDMEQK